MPPTTTNRPPQSQPRKPRTAIEELAQHAAEGPTLRPAGQAPPHKVEYLDLGLTKPIHPQAAAVYSNGQPAYAALPEGVTASSVGVAPNYPMNRVPRRGEFVMVNIRDEPLPSPAMITHVHPPGRFEGTVNLTVFYPSGVPGQLEGSPHDPTGQRPSHWRYDPMWYYAPIDEATGEVQGEGFPTPLPEYEA